jgi:hypothetical protein
MDRKGTSYIAKSFISFYGITFTAIGARSSTGP